ncbi:hypothetical protein F9U42_14305 [Pectobacterium versatile]|uniref:hypothetical protein n=1 Tax=Pectobacterium versatile TaxID=2488639 RepID=UPI001B36A67D|nr:hypothetical protein [Pectobacterium versatile]MBQ4768311.1 hypothetical protein [Pectobacterium versatile]
MKIQSFMNYYGSVGIALPMIKIANSEDDLGVVLRIHLLCEKFLEAWICGITGHDNLFSEAPQSGDFQMEFFQKLKMCQLTGLPESAYKSIKKINDIRNSFAHRLSVTAIKDSEIDSVYHHVGKLAETYLSFPLSKFQIKTNDEDGKTKYRYELESRDTPNRAKLICLYSALIMCLFSYLKIPPYSSPSK